MIDQLASMLKELGGLMLDWRARGITGGHWEGPQLKADADRLAHAFIHDTLQQLYPDIQILSEEDKKSYSVNRAEKYWLIDPIDGTASFCNGFDGFVTQIALMYKCKPILAVVHAPALNLTYMASETGPARCNDVSIHTYEPGCRKPVLIDNYPEPQGIARTLYDEIQCGGYIESGSIGLKICRVADGTADLFVKDVVIRDWDIAPAELILSRAGGVLTTLDGKSVVYEGSFEKNGIVAGNDSALLNKIHIT